MGASFTAEFGVPSDAAGLSEMLWWAAGRRQLTTASIGSARMPASCVLCAQRLETNSQLFGQGLRLLLGRERPMPLLVRHGLRGRRRVEFRELRNALEQNLVGLRVA